MSERIRRAARYPNWKVFSPTGEYLAACHYPEDAAAVVAAWGEGTTIKWGRKVLVWTEGKDGRAGQSYDNVAAVAHSRLDNHRQKEGWT